MAAAAQKRQPLVDNSLDELDINVSALIKVAEELYSRLQPVSLRQDNDSLSADRQSYDVPMADHLATTSENILYVTRLLGRAVKELEI